MINHKSQDSVATHLKCGGIFNDHFTANLPLNLLVEIFFKSANFGKVTDKKVDCLTRFGAFGQFPA